MKKTFFIIVACSFFVVKLTGLLLDNEVERAVFQEFQRDQNGIIKVAKPKIYSENHQTALYMVNGHLQTPATYYDLFDNLRKRSRFDIILANTPFHSQTIEKAAELDNQVVLDFYIKEMNELSKKYERVFVLAFSYGGLIFTNLLSRGLLAQNIEVILYAPAIHISSNGLKNRLATKYLPKIFRNYYNYDSALFPTSFPVFSSGDDLAKEKLANEIGFRYKVFSALSVMYELDLDSRGMISQIDRPFHIIMAEDDNRVLYEPIYEECVKNSLCDMHSYKTGRHVIHYGKNKMNFAERIIKIIEGRKDINRELSSSK